MSIAEWIYIYLFTVVSYLFISTFFYHISFFPFFCSFTQYEADGHIANCLSISINDLEEDIL